MGNFNSKIRLEIISALNDAGIKATAAQLENLQNSIKSTEQVAGTLGEEMKRKFSPMTAVSAALSGNFQALAQQMVLLGAAAKGAALSVGAFTGIGLVIGGVTAGIKALCGWILNLQDEEDKAAAKAREMLLKDTKESTEAATKNYEQFYKEIDKATDAKMKELDATEKLIEAEARRKMMAEGASEDEIKNAQMLLRLKHEAAKASEDEAAQAQIAAKRKELKAAAQAESEDLIGKFVDQYNAIEDERAAAREEAIASAVSNARQYDRTFNEGKVEEYSRRAGEIFDANKGKEFDKRSADLDYLLQASKVKMDFVAKLTKDEEEAAQRFKVKKIEEQAQEVDRANEARAAELKAEDERHKLKMQNIKAEADAMKSAATQALSSAKARAETEFNLYKSGNAAQAIEAEKQDEEARKRLNKEAARYGGKWRIDELSRLYASGDEEGVRKTLSQWRKSSSFTPEVEAMVRAAAAQDNAKTTEQQLADIAKNTRGLAEKMDELLQVK